VNQQRDAPRVLVLVENLPLAWDRRLGKQVRTLVDAGYAVSVICRRDPGNRDVAGVDVHEYAPPRDAASKLGYAREYGYSWVMAALRILAAARRGFDVVQLCGPPDIYFPLGLLCRLFGRPVLLDQRDPSPELYVARYGSAGGVTYRVLRLLEHASYRSADRVVTVNETMRRMAVERGGVAVGATTVVGNGPVLADVRPGPRQPQLRRSREHLCCWIVAMGPQDRLDLGMRVVHQLVQVRGRTDCHFSFLGDGESREGAVRLAGELGVTDWVSFPGLVGQDEVFSHLATADVGIDPGMDETVSPVKAFEYMAFAVPLVAFDLREVRVLCGNGGVYAPPGDVEAFAELVDHLLDDPRRRREIGLAGRLRVEESLAWDHQAPAYVAVVDELVRRRGRTPPGHRRSAGSRADPAGPASDLFEFPGRA